MSGSTRIHLCWTIGLLTAIIIGLLTRQLYNIPDLVSYITFAATISSLILAALAIAYSIFSGGSTLNTLSLITKSASDLEQSIKTLGTTSGEVRDAAEGVKQSALNIADRLGQISTEVGKHTAMIDESLKSVSQLRKAEADKPEISGTRPPISQADAFSTLLNSGSLTGVYAFYLAGLSYKSKHSIPADFFSGKAYATREYTQGYLVASSSFEILSLEIGKEGEWTIEDFTVFNPQRVRASIDQRVQDMKWSATITKAYLDEISAIEKLFQISGE